MLKEIILKNRIALLSTLVLICTIAIRIAFFDFISLDMSYHLWNWCQFIASHEGITAYAHSFSDYPPLYTYILGFMVKLTSLKWTVGIKIISSFFDYLLAYYVYKIIALKHSKESLLPLLAALTICLLPSVLLNSAFWGQCDSIYTTFVIMSVYYILKDKITIAFILYSIALSFKLQAIFIFPFFIVLFLTQENIKLFHFSYIPLTYLITISPCLIAGRSFLNLFQVYINQANEYHNTLSHNAATVYHLLPNTPEIFHKPGVFFAIAIAALLVIVYVFKSTLKKEKLIEIAFVMVLFLPYFLPFMHERYFYLADILAVLFVFYYKRNFYYLFVPFVSMLSYMPFLFGTHIIDMKILALVMLGLICLASRDIVKTLPVNMGSKK